MVEMVNRENIIAKKICALLLFLIAFIPIYLNILAEGKTIEQLKNELEKAPDSKKCMILNKLAKAYWWEKPRDKVLKYGQEALVYAQKYKDIAGEIFALANIGFGYLRIRNDVKAEEYADKSLNMTQKYGMSEKLIDAIHITAEVYVNIPKYKISLRLYKTLRDICEEIGDKERVALYNHSIGSVYYFLGEIDKAVEFYKKTQCLYEEIGNIEGTINVMVNLGSLSSRFGDNDDALEYYFRAAEIAEKSHNEKMMAKVYDAIGYFFERQKQYQKGIAYYEKELEIAKKLKNNPLLRSTYLSLGDISLKAKHYDKALENYNKAMAYQKKIEVAWKDGVADILLGKGQVYFAKKRYSKAATHFKQALQVILKLKEHRNEATCYKYLGEIYLIKGDFENSLLSLKKALIIAQKLKRTLLIQEIYKSMADLHDKFGKYKDALHYFKLHSELKDKFYDITSAEKIAEMQTKYETEKKEQEIEVLKKNNQIQKLKLERQRIVRLTFILAFLLIALVLTLFIRKYRYLLTFWKRKNHIGHYRLMDKIASGGMGVVYKAHDVLDKSKQIAIKVLREEYFTDEAQKKRFKNEAAIIDQFDHPHIVKVIERGEADGNLYIAMELLEGRPLDALIKEEGRFSVAIALHIMTQVAEAVAKIHQKNIIHRDLKPGNIMLVEKEDNPYFVKLLDFGLSKTGSFTRMTRTGMILGTIFYLSPEQVLGKDLSPASDIYSLGVIFYEMLSGEKPFSGESEENIIQQILEKEPIEIIMLRPDVPEELNHLIMQMVSKKSTRRPSIETVSDILNSIRDVEREIRDQAGICSAKNSGLDKNEKREYGWQSMRCDDG